MTLSLVMLTCNRTPAYLTASLTSLFGSDETVKSVKLLVHESPKFMLPPEIFAHDIQPRWLTTEEHEVKMRLQRRNRAGHGMRLALESVEGPCIFLEDDTVYEPNWLQTFTDELSRFDLHEGDVIVIRSHLKWQRPGFVRWDPRSYYGTVALYFTDTTRRKAIEALALAERQKHAEPGIGGDVAIKNWLVADRSVRLFARFPNLIEHTGEISSIASPTIRQKRLGREMQPKKDRPPVSWPSPTSRPSAPTNPVVHVHQPVTTKQRKNPNPPVTMIKKT